MNILYDNTCKRCVFFFILSSLFSKSRGSNAPALLLCFCSGVSPIKTVSELAAPTLMAVVPVPNDAGKPQRSPVGGEVRFTPPNNLIRINGGQTVDECSIVQFGFVGLDEQRHTGNDAGFRGVGYTVPRLGQQGEHPGE